MTFLAVSAWGLAPTSSIEVLDRPNQAHALPGNLLWDIQNYHTIINADWASYFQEPDDDEEVLPETLPHHHLTTSKKTHRSANAIHRAQRHNLKKERYYLKLNARRKAFTDEHFDEHFDVSMYGWHTEHSDYEHRPYDFSSGFVEVVTQANVVAFIGFSAVGAIIPNLLQTLIAEYTLLSVKDIPRLIDTSDACLLPNELKSLIMGYS
jgi:hypothetical protein